jgi:dTDP-4-dehydrorhamnose reductase
VAVIGAAGQVGTDLMRALADWVPIGLNHADLEVADGAGVLKRLQAIGPDVVITCAAFHRVDECEHRPDEAFRINAIGARNVALACARLRALCVCISTDYVFDGEQGRPYAETDPPRPVNVYGASKLAGELLVAAATPRHLIVRIASVFGVAGARGKGGNFVETMIAKAKAGEDIRVVNDLIMSPTYAADAATRIRALIDGGHTGIVHAANAGGCTWLEFAQAIFGELGWDVRIEAQRTSDLAQAARRPRNSSLAPARLQALGLTPARWEDALRRYLVARGHLPQARADAATRPPRA